MPLFKCSLSQEPMPLIHVWEHTIGSGHATLGLRADWQAQLRRCHEELGLQHVRFHGILSDDMGTLIRQNDELLYSFFNADQIYDFLLSIGMRPFVELSFMPEALSSGGHTVFHYEANVTPPQDYQQWATLIHKLVAHWVDRYGREEVRRWYFEVWNEPNLDSFWRSSQWDYFQLYRHTAEAIKAVDPDLQVGGPATAKTAWIEDFLDFCQAEDLPADFVSTHSYPTDALGSAQDDTITKLAQSHPTYMQEKAAGVQRQARGRPVYFTEWNISSNPRDALHDQPFAAALVTKILMELNDTVDGYSFWTFTDIFEENYFPSIPFQGGFGLLNLHGIPKPTYRAYELLHRLGNEQLAVEGAHETVDAWVVRKGTQLTVLLTNFALPRHSIQTEIVHVQLADVPKPQAAYVERIDEEHSNPRRLWQEMGEPTYLSRLDVEQLQAASHLAKRTIPWQYQDQEDVLSLDIDLPPHSVAAITVEVERSQE